MKKQILIILTLLCYCSDTNAQILDSMVGQWICSGYEKLNYPLEVATDKYCEDYQNDNFALEFMRYSYFDIRGERDSTFSISVVDRFETPFLQSIEMDVDSTANIGYNQEIANSILEYYSVSSGSFLKPTNNYTYYVDALPFPPSIPYYIEMPFSELMYYKEDGIIVVPYKGFVFLYRKGDFVKGDYNVEGVPGDNYNYFVVNRTFKDMRICDVYEIFRIDFPFGSDGFPNELPLSNYTNYEKHHDITMEWNTEQLLRIKTKNTMGAFKIEFEQIGSDVRLLYRFSFWDEDFGEDFDG